ncbi:MAG: hypothetical protein H7X99_06860 [Saprospiraceae bacterium]|nr:hypothetical protein [Saprospiraceae bacterium]
MVRALLLAGFFSLSMSSCMDIDENILPVVGVYRAHVIGVAGPFDLIISTDRGDDILIESKLDGFEWYTAKADIDNQTDRVMDIKIPDQQIGSGTYIKGDGFFRDGTVELRYSIDFGAGEIINFKIVATKN